MAATEWAHFKQEGTVMPDFSFEDLDGKRYDKVNTKGKTLLLKCWFINCVACVKEFPELNKLVDRYQNNKEVLFVSLAMDPKNPLVKFLQTRAFKYATVPDMTSFMANQLKVTQYPTHILVDKNGIIKKVVNKIEDLEPFIEREVNRLSGR